MNKTLPVLIGLHANVTLSLGYENLRITKDTGKIYLESGGVVVQLGSATSSNATLLANGWSSTAPYTQTIPVTGILATDTPLIGVVQSADTALAKMQILNWSYISRIDTTDGNIVATCYDTKPTVDLPIQIKITR